MTKRWFVEDHANQPHLWEEDTTVFDWLKSQLDPETGPSSVSQVGGAVGSVLVLIFSHPHSSLDAGCLKGHFCKLKTVKSIILAPVPTYL